MAYHLLNLVVKHMVFTRKRQAKTDSVLGLDLGASHLKAALLHRQNGQLALVEYAVRKLPMVTYKNMTASQLGAEVQELLGQLKTTDRRAVVTLSCPSVIVCHAQLPRMPITELRAALQINSVRYLRRDFSNYHFDVAVIPEFGDSGKVPKQTVRVLVGGASREDITWYRTALGEAKVRPWAIELAAVSVVNAFQASHREICEKEVVILVDIGARSTTMNFLRQGLPVMTRIMHFGGSQLSEHIAQVLSLKPEEAEEEKLKMSEPVQTLIKTAIRPLARELRASIDYFERQEECHLTRTFACGGSALSPQILQDLGEEVGVKFERWDPLHNFDLSQLNGDLAVLKAQAPGFAAAVGAAVARLTG